METTLFKGLSLLEALAKSPNVSGVTELAKHLNITKSNAHRLLQTLLECGYVRNVDRSGRYELTLRLWELGALLIGRLDIKSVSSEYVERLCHVSGETVHLSILDGSEVVYIEKMDSTHAIRAYSQVGGRVPAYCVATGKALLAHAPTALIDAISLRLVPYSSRTITSPKELLAELETIRSSGYAVNRGEWRDGVWGIAAPLWDASGRVCAAIGVSGPVDRFKQRRIKQLASEVMGIAEQISGRLGYRPTPEKSPQASRPE